ncbi:MAG: DinB family protein [Gemmatimonadota bacterium]
MTAATSGLEESAFWVRPGGVAPIGFHVVHIAGSVDRLFTYARGSALDQQQLADLASERHLADEKPTLESMFGRLRGGLQAAVGELRGWDQQSLMEARSVGRARLPSTSLGLLFHAAEHAARHAGQIVTLSKIVAAG